MSSLGFLSTHVRTRISFVLFALFLFGTSAICAQQALQDSDKQLDTTSTLNADVTANMNQRLMELAAAQKATQGDYLIGPGDVLGMEVFDVPEFTRDIHVTETGYIDLPLIAKPVFVSGLTALQLQDKIEDLLRTNGLVSDPEVTVTVKEEHGQPVTVIGAVRNPLVFEAGRQTTLLEVLSRAGGISDDAGSTVMVTRTSTPVETRAPGQSASSEGVGKAQTFTININDLLDTGDPRFNIPIIGGDVVSVPRAGIIYVLGAVNHPGGFVLANDRDRMTALKAMALAGGISSTAKANHAVILRNDADSGKRQEVSVNLHNILRLQGEDITLQASDILYVPDSTGKKAIREVGTIGVAVATGAILYRVAY